MIKTLLAGTTLLLLASASQAAPAPAQIFTPAQRDAIVAIVRQALKSDPTILHDAVTTLQTYEEAQSQADQRAAILAHHKDLFTTFNDPIAGNPNGDVTLVEFYDPRCPYCRKMLPKIEALLKQDHGVRLVYKDIPVLGPLSTLETRAILAAQKQGAYLKMQTALMTNPAQPDQAMIDDTAKDLGLDPARLKADMNSPATTQRINANLELAHSLKVDGTPTWMIGEQSIPGEADVSQLADAIAQARKPAAK